MEKKNKQIKENCSHCSQGKDDFLIISFCFLSFVYRAWLRVRCWNINFEGSVFLMLMKLLVHIPILMIALKFVSKLRYALCLMLIYKLILAALDNFLPCISVLIRKWIIQIFMGLLFFSYVFILQLQISVWANHGDDVSIQYSGTPALKGDFVRYT